MAAAEAQVEPLKARLVSDGTHLRAQFSITNAFTESFRKRMAGGLTNRAVLAIELLDMSSDVFVVRQRKCELRVDVWDDRVYARVTDEDRERRRIYALIDDGLRACGLVDVPLTTVDRLTAPTYRLRVQIALNPISPELRERSREFMSNPQGTASSRTPAFFGAVARLFRSESAAGGTVFVFQSGRLKNPVSEETPR